MNTIQRIALRTAALGLVLSLGACANMSRHDLNTTIGAGTGAVIGGALTGGSPIGVVGGAAVGGVIGSEIPVRR